MDFLKFAYLIETKTLWFNRIDKFEDVYEGTYPYANAVLRPEVYGKGNVISEATYATMENYGRSRIYVSCFHANSFDRPQCGVCIPKVVEWQLKRML